MGKLKLIASYCATPIDYKNEDFVATVRSKGGVQAVFDHVGGEHIHRSLSAIRPSGVVVSYGAYGIFKNGRISPLGSMKALISRMGFDSIRLLTQSKTLVGYSIGMQRDHRNDAFREDFSVVMSLLKSGRIAPTIDCVLPLADAAKAHERLQNASICGKIVLVN